MAKRLKPLHQPWKPKRKAQSGRKTNDSKIYQTADWRRFRLMYISENPICELCELKGLTVEGKELDHINPIRLGGAMYDVDNVQFLCRSCHAKKSAGERGL